MIVRTWTARTTVDQEPGYLEKVKAIVLPHLQAADGYLGSQFLRRLNGDRIEIIVLTYWKSMEAAKLLSGDKTDQIYLPPEIEVTLEDYDEHALHFDVLVDDLINRDDLSTL